MQLDEFLANTHPRLKEVVERYPRLFAPPDRHPPDRAVKHFIYTPSDVVPVSRPAYPLGETKRAAMKEQMRELIDKGWGFAL